MAIVYSPNIIEIAAVHTYGGRPSVNVWHMWFDAELGTDTIEDVVGDFRDNWQDHVLDICATTLVLNRFEWRSLDPGNNTLGTMSPAVGKPTTGAIGGGAASANVAMLVHKNTDSRPRGRRDGRCYLSGLVESYVDEGGNINGTLQSAAATALTAFYNGISDTSGSASGDRYPAVLETTPASRAPGSASVVIGSRRVTSITLDTKAATQRDRLR